MSSVSEDLINNVTNSFRDYQSLDILRGACLRGEGKEGRRKKGKEEGRKKKEEEGIWTPVLQVRGTEFHLQPE